MGDRRCYLVIDPTTLSPFGPIRNSDGLSASTCQSSRTLKPTESKDKDSYRCAIT